jgi:predicted transcriptional regulator
MSVQTDSVETSDYQLTEDDVAYLMNLLRNATQPMTTQELIDALRRQTGQTRGTSS